MSTLFDATHTETGYLYAAYTTFSACRDAATGGPYEGNLYDELYTYYGGSPDRYRISRGRIRFDTSSLSVVPVSAILRIAFFRNISTGSGHSIHIVGGSGLGDNMAVEDYGTLKNYEQELCPVIYNDDLPINTYIDRTIDPDKLGIINPGGYTIIGLRSSLDYSNIAPVEDVSRVWVSPYEGYYETASPHLHAKLIVEEGEPPVSGQVDDRVMGIRRMASRKGKTFLQEITLGGLPTRWTAEDMTKMIPQGLEGEVKGPYMEMDTGRFFLLLPNGEVQYLDNMGTKS